MPSFEIVRYAHLPKSFREKSICGTFDIQRENQKETFSGSFDLPTEWNIGVIYGNSGTGKSTIAKEIFSDAYIMSFDYNQESVIENMPDCSLSDIEKAFTSVGFSSPPSWLKPYSVLSNGEKMRTNLARALLEKREMIVFDEFTSVVDRNVAKIASVALSKAVRSQRKKFIAVTCHDDILEWLEPDWTFCTNDMSFNVTRGLLCRPKISIDVRRCKTDLWRYFKKYHYMSDEIHKASACFVAVKDDCLTAFISVMHFPHPKTKNIYRVHRLVVLPDYQGIGIGRNLLECVGDIYKGMGKRFRITTSQPGLVSMLKKSKRWILDHQGRNGKHSGNLTGMAIRGSQRKIVTSWELIS